MDREVDLLGYLPDFVKKFEEIKQIVGAENPEIQKLENEIERLKKNQFIETCDSEGLKRYENMMKIVTESIESLDARRARVYFKWQDILPYTYRNLLIKMEILCQDLFKADPDFKNYRIGFLVSLPSAGQVEELERMLSDVLPCNLIWSVTNTINHSLDAVVYTATGTVTKRSFTVNTLEEEE